MNVSTIVCSFLLLNTSFTNYSALAEFENTSIGIYKNAYKAKITLNHKATITQSDLPSNFKASEKGKSDFAQSLNSSGLIVEQAFAFQSDSPIEMIMGATTRPPKQLEQSVGRESNEALARAIDKSLPAALDNFKSSGFKLESQQRLTGLEGVGNAAQGATGLMKMFGLPIRINLVMFRRDLIIVVLATMHMSGDAPLVPIQRVARELDNRLQSSTKANVELAMSIQRIK